MVGSWFLQIVPHRLWFSAAAEKYAADVRHSSIAVRYGLAFLIAFVGILSRSLMVPYWGAGVPLITFYPAVLFAALLGGFGGGVLATLTLAIAAAYLFFEPLRSLRVINSGEAVGIVFFISLGCVISFFVETLIGAREAAQQASDKAYQAQLDAESANATKDQFLAMISHELRTPLHAILSAIQVLRNKSRTPSELDPIVNIIERNAKAEARLVQDLLDLSRFSAGKMMLDCDRSALRPILEAVIECMQPVFDDKGLAVCRTHAGPDRPVWIDRQRIEQVMFNLLTNAAKFTDSGGWIKVDLDERSPSQIVLSVADSGIGIDDDLKKDLFRPFMQGDTVHRRAGLGLGLAIVKGLVELHGGTVEALSDGKGKGSRFVVRLPVTAVQAGTLSA